MATCPSCQAKVEEGAGSCPKCGRVIPASQLENIPVQTSGWQKFVIVVTVILLVIIAFTFYGAEKREDVAAQQIFSQQMPELVQSVALQSGLGNVFGIPSYSIQAKPKAAEVVLSFPSGPLTQAQAAMAGNAVCARLAQIYVRKGYMPRHLRVIVTGDQPGGRAVYGQSIYNGNIDALGWEPASR